LSHCPTSSPSLGNSSPFDLLQIGGYFPISFPGPPLPSFQALLQLSDRGQVRHRFRRKNPPGTRKSLSSEFPAVLAALKYGIGNLPGTSPSFPPLSLPLASFFSRVTLGVSSRHPSSLESPLRSSFSKEDILGVPRSKSPHHAFYYAFTHWIYAMADRLKSSDNRFMFPRSALTAMSPHQGLGPCPNSRAQGVLSNRIRLSIH